MATPGRETGEPTFRRQGPVRWFDPVELFGDIVREWRAHRRAAAYDIRERRARGDAGPAVETVDLSEAGEVWFDHVADSGDGFGATFAVAELLARARLEVEGLDVEGLEGSLPSGSLVVCGGDQVYAHPYGDQYRDRFVGPYAAACPAAPGGSPDRFMVAIPGDHDWWDGLESFVEVFCSGTHVGAWRVPQSRSYFSVRLPRDWWLWGIDASLTGSLDGPQVDYFEQMAARAMALATTRRGSGETGGETDGKTDGEAGGDMDGAVRVVVFVATPSWLQSESDPALAVVDGIVARHRGMRVVALVTGDKHFYARHQPVGGGPVRVVNGRGGAFLSATDRVPDEIAVEGGATGGRARLAAQYPSAAASRRVRRRVLLAGRRQGSFWLIPAAVYLLWLLPARLRAAALGLLGAGAALAVRGRPWRQRLAWGGGHAAGHAVVMAAAGLLAGGRRAPVARRAAGLAATGATAGSLVVGTYLLAAGQAAGINDTETFSAVGEQGYKGFVRFHLDAKGSLRLYAIGLDATLPAQDWVAATDPPPGSPRFVPRPGAVPDMPRLVDEVVELA